MCEETYSGCPNCKADSEEIRYECNGYVSVTYSIDSDGHPYERLEVSDADDSDSEGTLYCTNCGHSDFTQLEDDLIPDDCPCDECYDEPRPRVENYEDEWLFIERLATVMRPPILPDDAPAEVRKLCERRSLTRLPVRVDRATAVMDWCEENLPNGCIYMRLATPPPALRGLAVPEPTEHQLELEAT